MNPEDFFYNSVKWQEKFNELSTIELTLMAIISLLNCPNGSCRTNVLYERALKQFNVRTSRKPKEDFKKSFNKIIRNLISKKVFREYNKKNPHPRIKINEIEQRDNFHRLLRRYHKAYMSKAQSEISFIKNTSSDEHKNLTTISTETDDYSLKIDENDAFNQDFNSDDESNSFLDDLLNDEIPELETEQNIQKHSEQNLNISEIKDIIKAHYNKIDVIDIKEVYPDYKLILKGDVLDIEILIEFKLKNSIHLKCFIDFLPDAAIDILKLFGKNNFDATICVEDFHPREYYVIKQNIDITIYDDIEIISLIDNLIKTARYTSQIISRFL